MKNHHMRALVAIADCGGIHAAARALAITQPAITKAIRDLETEFSVPLVNRGSSGATLTSEGHALASRARLILHEIERAREDMAQFRGECVRRLSIGVASQPSMMEASEKLLVLPEAFRLFRVAYQDMAVEFLALDCGEFAERLALRTMDFVVAGSFRNENRPEVVREELYKMPLAFSTRRDGVFAGSVSLRDVQAAEWLHTDSTMAYPQMLADLFARRGLPPPKRITRCTSQTMLANLMQNSDTVWTAPALDSPGPHAKWAKLKLEENPPVLTVSIYTHENLIKTKPIDYFLQCIQQVNERRWRALAA